MRILEVDACGLRIESKAKKTLKIAFISGLALHALSGGCVRKKDDTKTITWAFWGSPEAVETYTKIVGGFQDENPETRVNLLNIAPGAYGTKLKTMIAGGTAPDIFWVGENIADYVLRGTIQQLDSLVERDKNIIGIDDFYEATLDAGRFQGKLYGIPKGINPIIIAYNKDMFDEEGLHYPSEDWSWDDFLSLARKLTKDKNGDGKIDQFGFCGLGKEYWQWLPFILQSGGSIFNEGETECNFNSPETREGLEFYINLVHKYHVAPSLGQTADLDFFSQFTNRRVAMTMGAHTFVLIFNRHKNLNWDIVPFPKGKYRATVLTLGFFVISTQTKHLNEAWKFVSYVTGREAAAEYFGKLGEEMPPRKSLSHIQDNPEILPEHHQVFFDVIKDAYPLPVVPAWQQIYDIIMKEIELAILRESTVEEASATIKEKVDKILSDSKLHL